MKLLKTITVASEGRTSKIQLFRGDLTEIPVEHAVDVLVVSAFRGIYQPVSGTLIGALHKKGLSVAALAKIPEVDRRKDFSCWLSKPIQNQISGLSFERILCFEPESHGRAPEVVGDIFRTLAPFIHGPAQVRTVALPLIATGRQGNSISKIMPELLFAAVSQLQAGLPLDTIKIVVFRETDAKRALRLFNKPVPDRTRAKERITWLQRLLRSKKQSEAIETLGATPSFDVFLSYSRKDKGAARYVADALQRSGLRVFIDEREIDIGASWQQSIWNALETSHRTVALYSPDFVASRVCQDEFNTAMILRRRRGDDFIFPLLVRDCALPAYMEMINFSDCRVSDKAKLTEAAMTLAANLKAET